MVARIENLDVREKDSTNASITTLGRCAAGSPIACGSGLGGCSSVYQSATRPPFFTQSVENCKAVERSGGWRRLIMPLHAKSLAGLPPAYVITAGFDVLRDEGIEYVEALRKAGVQVEHASESAMPHGFITMTRLCSEAQTQLEAIASRVHTMVSGRPAVR